MAKKQRKKKRKPSPSFRLSFDRILIYGVASAIFLLPLFFWPTVTEYGYGKTIAGLIAISALSVLWGLSAWQKGSWSIRIPWIAFPVLGFVFASLLSLVHATNGRVVVQSLVLLIFFFQLLLIIANVVRERRDVHLLLAALLMSAFLATLYGLLQYLGALPGAHTGAGVSNMISTMGNRNYLGGFLAYLLVPVIVLVLRPRSRWLRAISIPLIAFCFGTATLIRQTGVNVSLAVAGIVLLAGLLIFRPFEPIRRNRRWLLVFLGVLILTFLIEAPSAPWNSVVGLSNDGSSWIVRFWEKNSGNVRTWDWWIGWEMFKDHPLTGVGLGNYKLNFVPYKAAFLSTPRGEAYNFPILRAAQAHNEYVQILAELGVLGALALVSFLVVLILSLWKRLRTNPDPGARFDLLLFCCGIVAFFTHSLVSFPAHLPASSLVVVLLGGLIFSRVYGDVGILRVKLSGWSMKGSVTAILLIGLVVSVVAVRDLSANVWMKQGIEQIALGNYYGAEWSLKRSIALDFAPRQAYYHLATAQLRLGKLDEAQENLERCLTRFVDESVYLSYANLMVNTRQPEPAREAIELLLAGYPRAEIETKARYLEALVFSLEGDYSTAIDRLEKLVEDDPTFQTAYLTLGSFYQGRGMPVNARKNYDKALQLIEKKLAKAQATLEASRGAITAETYGTLRSQIEQLTEERTAVLERLAQLPDSPSP